MNYPLVNGFRHSYASIVLSLKGRQYIGHTAISYKDSVERGKPRGAHAQSLGRTKGDYDTEASITMLAEEANEFLAALGDGTYDQVFDITVTYADDGAPTITDKLWGCRLNERGRDHSQGTDALAMTFPIDPTYIEFGNRKPFKKMLS